MNKKLSSLISEFGQIAKNNEMPIDKDIYDKAGKSPNEAILYTGNLNADLGVLARDLGKDEVINSAPLIGSGGQSLRRVITEYVTGDIPPKKERQHEEAMKHIMFTNIVPFKPIGNKVFPKNIRQMFVPLVAEFLIYHWKGSYLMALGTEAFRWFENFCDKLQLDNFWNSGELRYINHLECEIHATVNAQRKTKALTVAPLPHPSPLNRKWVAKFPELLRKRLSHAMPKN